VACVTSVVVDGLILFKKFYSPIDSLCHDVPCRSDVEFVHILLVILLLCSHQGGYFHKLMPSVLKSIG
jgi:hypothetical protein